MAKEKINCEIAWDSKGNPLFAIIPIQLETMSHTAVTDKGVLCIDGKVDNTSEEVVKIKDGKLIMVE